jgi:phospholipase C
MKDGSMSDDPAQPDSPDQRLSRRHFLASAAAGVGLVVAGSGLDRIGPAAAATPSPLPLPAGSGIDHVVVLMMENRSFDHYLGWVPGAEGRQGGLSYYDDSGIYHSTYHLTSYQGCGFNDPDHSYVGGRVEYNSGACDGWLRAGSNDILCIGYYEQSDLAFYGRAASYWTTCDHWFAATMGPTYPNRLYMHAAQTDRISNTSTTSVLPTIWDLLAAAGISHSYYFSDIPFTALWGSKYAGISRTYGEFLADCASGALPAVSFLDPRFEDEGSGTSGDDHPHADIRVGQSFLNQVYEAVTSSPIWANTVFVITYDEWGGFFDHVAPTVAPDATPSNGLRGFRVPALVISPLARRNTVAHNIYDHTSALRMIEWRWGLPALTPRDAGARNLAEVLDFISPPDLTAPRWAVPTVTPQPCAPSGTTGTTLEPTEHELTWQELAVKAAASGFIAP